ncbi:hypothetical protein D9M69_686750 [compost metagenome]
MNDSRAFMARDDLFQQSTITNVARLADRCATSDLFHAMESFRIAVIEIIDHHHFMTGLNQLYACMRTDISSATSYKNRHA